MRVERRAFRAFIVAVMLLLPQVAHGQDFMLQGWYWDYPKTADGFNWANTLEGKAQELSDAGFTYVWLPPLSRAASGAYSNGYDPKDLFDLGEFGQGPTGFGTRADVDDLVAALQAEGVSAVADVVYNHRDGGAPEDNPAVAGWIRNMTFAKIAGGDQPYPSDRFRLILPVGGTTGRGAGTYYFKFASASGHPNFHNKPYKVYMETNTVGFQGLPNDVEAEPNGGGGGCGEPNNPIQLGVDMFANIDAFGCTIDEFALTLNAGDFDANGDLVYIYLNNRNVGGLGDYSDHTVRELYYSGGGGNIEGALIYQTYTDFTGLPSGQGAMTYANFKPNGNPTQLAGDFDAMFFFYDYDQNVTGTRNVLFDWSRWLWNDAGIRGYRMDAVKHFPPNFVGDLLDNLHDNGIDPGMVVGEFFDGNAGALNQWLIDVYANMDADTKAAIFPRVFDFSLRYALEAASDAFGYDARNVFNAGLADAQGTSGFNVVTFVDNHDFRAPGQPVDNDPILGYAYILTNNQLGLPSVYYYDYENRGLQPKIDALIAAHRAHIFGASQRDYLSRFGTPYVQSFTSGYESTTLFYQLSGTPSGRDVLVAINYAGEPLDVTHGVNVSTMNLQVGDQLTDVLGLSGSPTLKVAADGTVRIQLPPRSYSVWVLNDPLCTDAGTAPFWNGTLESNGDGTGYLPLQAQAGFGVVTLSQPSNNLVLRKPTDTNGVTIDDFMGTGTGDQTENTQWTYQGTNPPTEIHQQVRAPADAPSSFYLEISDTCTPKPRTLRVDPVTDFHNVATAVASEDLPETFALSQNYPNPFNPVTVITYALPEAAQVRLSVYDVLGKEVASLSSGYQTAGTYEVRFDAAHLSAGVYLYVIEAGGFRASRQMVLLK